MKTFVTGSRRQFNGDALKVWRRQNAELQTRPYFSLQQYVYRSVVGGVMCS